MPGWGDLASRSHAYIGPGMPELIGTTVIVGETLEEEYHLDRRYTDHHYTYGLSKQRLRPEVLDEDYEKDAYLRAQRERFRLLPISEGKPRPWTRKTLHIEPVVVGPSYPVAEPVVFPETLRSPRYRISEPVRKHKSKRKHKRRPLTPEERRLDYSVETMLEDLLTE